MGTMVSSSEVPLIRLCLRSSLDVFSTRSTTCRLPQPSLSELACPESCSASSRLLFRRNLGRFVKLLLIPLCAGIFNERFSFFISMVIFLPSEAVLSARNLAVVAAVGEENSLCATTAELDLLAEDKPRGARPLAPAPARDVSAQSDDCDRTPPP
jgi:hypothetical protein